MKTLLFLALLVSYVRTDCPTIEPFRCPYDEVNCPGGFDSQGCSMPDVCIPAKGGPMGKDGFECPSHCPAACYHDDLVCPGGKDWNDCEGPAFCAPSKGPMGKDGVECPAFCPINCGPEEMHCPGGTGWNDCPQPDSCIPAKGRWKLFKNHKRYCMSCHFFFFPLRRTNWKRWNGLPKLLPNELRSR